LIFNSTNTDFAVVFGNGGRRAGWGGDDSNSGGGTTTINDYTFAVQFFFYGTVLQTD
jgi:hypothetical protein